ncbi:MAG: hypothetical protein ACYCR4_13275 [Acidimicrobiales bacterium]
MRGATTRRPGYRRPAHTTPSPGERRVALDATVPGASPAEIDRARCLAEQLLGTDSAAYRHSAGATARATTIEDRIVGLWRPALVPAAWLHEIGHSRHVAQTGCVQLDAARYLRYLRWPTEVCRLVAHQGAGYAHAQHLGLVQMLVSEFPEPTIGPYIAINWAHLTISASGAAQSIKAGIDQALQGCAAARFSRDDMIAAEDDLRRGSGFCGVFTAP